MALTLLVQVRRVEELCEDVKFPVYAGIPDACGVPPGAQYANKNKTNPQIECATGVGYALLPVLSKSGSFPRAVRTFAA